MNETHIPDQQDIEKQITYYADQLRAGLLDEQPRLKTRVESVLARHSDAGELWRQIGAELAHEPEPGISHRLRNQRRAALQRARTFNRTFVLWPQWATATAVAVALAAGLTWLYSSHLAVPDPVVQQVTLNDGSDLKEVSENLDFYAWLDNQIIATGPGQH